MPGNLDAGREGLAMEADRTPLKPAKLAGGVFAVGELRDFEFRQFARIADDDGRRLGTGGRGHETTGTKYTLGGSAAVFQK